MPEGIIKWEAIIGHQKAINSVNKINAAHKKEIALLERKLAVSKKATKEGKKATRAQPTFGSSIRGAVSFAAALALINRGLQDGVRIQRESLAQLNKQKRTRTAIGQLGVGKSLDFSPRIVKASRQIARTSVITDPGVAQQVAFDLMSRLEISPEEAGRAPSFEFLKDPVLGLSLAADVQRQFPRTPQGMKGLLKILGGLLVGAEKSKVNLTQLSTILPKPSQVAQELGLDFSETVSAASAGVSGVGEVSEAATQLRSLLSRILKAPDPLTKKLKRTVRSEGFPAMLRQIQGFTESQKLRAFPEKREAQAALFFSKEAQIQAIESRTGLIREGIQFATEGGNKDEIQRQRRILQFDRQRQITRSGELKQIKAQQATELSDAPARASIAQGTREQLKALRMQADPQFGLGTRGALAMDQVMLFFSSLFQDPESTAAFGAMMARNFVRGPGVGAADRETTAAEIEDQVFVLNPREETGSVLDAIFAIINKFDKAITDLVDSTKGRARP